MPDKIVNHFVLADGSTAKYNAEQLAGDVPEVADIRVGADGITYANAGNAVRAIENKMLTELDIPFEIGNNRYVQNGYLQFAENAQKIRASCAPRSPISDKIYIVPKNSYRFSVGVCLDDATAWEQRVDNSSVPVTVDLSDINAFFIQILRDSTIPDDAKPLEFYADIQGELNKEQELNNNYIFNYPLNVEVGINRFSDNGQLRSVSNGVRASTPPFSVAQFDKLKLNIGNDTQVGHQYDVYAAYQYMDYNGIWASGSQWVSGKLEIDTTNISEICLCFRRFDGGTVQSDTDFGKLTCFSKIEGNLSTVFSDVNKSTLWEIGSLGSSGENYNGRLYELRTKNYLNIDLFSFATFGEDVSYSFCVYDESKNFLYRYRVLSDSKLSKAKVLNDYPNAKYYRLTLWVDETDVTDVSNYSLCKLYHVGGLLDGIAGTSNIVDIQEQKKQEVSVFKLKKSSNENYTDCDLKALFVTDIHGETERTQRAVELVNSWGSSYFDAILNGGDTCVLTDTESLTWYNSAVLNSTVPVLNTIGNHDAWSSLGVLETDPKVPYNLIIAPVANSTSIVQPANAAANGYNYYYKDFNSKVRVIVIDCMFWDNAQKTWLDSVLSDARTNGLHVVCVTHASFPWADMETVDCLWSKAGFLNGYSDAAAINDPTRTNIQAAASVKDFIDAGGSFVCWLTGHQHGDDVHILPNYGNQFVITMPSFVQRASMLQKNTDNRAYNYDVLTYVAVDTTNKNVKFSRIGANIDMYGVEHNGISIDYENNTLKADW